ncbi:MAG: nucleoside deaminase [Alphaproteobacteria bacterium]|nr:nucleoside deaminase [Alphaproteobacteria bacterium]
MNQMHYMTQALLEARAAALRGEVPIGAVVVEAATGKVLAAAGNETEQSNDPTAHAELLALQRACKIKGAPRLPDCDVYVTLEPCPMCATALSFARIRRVYFGAYDPKGGGIEHGPKIFSHPTCHHKPETYGGIEEQACSGILKEFFRERR